MKGKIVSLFVCIYFFLAIFLVTGSEFNEGLNFSYKINESRFGNGDELDGDRFGWALASMGDLDGDGVIDLAVSEAYNDDGGTSNGAVWIMFMNSDSTVKSSYKINESRFGNGDELDSDVWGVSLANIGDLDGDGIVDLAVGERLDDDGGTDNGAVWILFMNSNGSVKNSYKINESRFGNGDELNNGDLFGYSVANIGDLDGDGVVDLAVGARLDDDGGTDNGAVWILFMNSNGSVKSSYKINESRFGNGDELDGDWFGSALANLGDLDGDGVVDLAVGEYNNDDGGISNGAFWVLFMNKNGSVKSSYKINESRFGNGDELNSDGFGSALANLGDLDGDGVVDLAVGEYNNDDGGISNGAFWILFMNSNGSVKDSYKINESRFGNGDELDGGYFGSALASIGDLNGDGIVDLAVGERLNDDGGDINGAFWIFSLDVINSSSPRLHLDITSPEAIVQFNIDTKELEVLGFDNIDSDVDVSYEEICIRKSRRRCKLPGRVYTLEDSSGNVLTMELSYRETKNRIIVKVRSLDYGDGVSRLDRNKLVIRGYDRKNNIRQYISFKNDFKIKTKYYNNIDETKITIREDGSSDIFWEEENIALRLTTNKGDLYYDF